MLGNQGLVEISTAVPKPWVHCRKRPADSFPTTMFISCSSCTALKMFVLAYCKKARRELRGKAIGAVSLDFILYSKHAGEDGNRISGKLNASALCL